MLPAASIPDVNSAHCRCVGWSADARTVRMLFPLADSGTVQDMIDQSPGGISPPTAASLFHGMCAGLQAMHSHAPPYAHRDIKPANILLYGATPVLTDFGSASEAVLDVPSRKEVRFLSPHLPGLWRCLLRGIARFWGGVHAMGILNHWTIVFHEGSRGKNDVEAPRSGLKFFRLLIDLRGGRRSRCKSTRPSSALCPFEPPNSSRCRLGGMSTTR